MNGVPATPSLDSLDRALINRFQDGIPVCDRPFAECAASLAIPEEEVVARLERLLADGVLSRFGPMYQAERLGGGLTLAAMVVPVEKLEEISEQVNAFPEVAHNYARDHTFNLWFVVATERPEQVTSVLAAIETATGYRVYAMPKIEEFFVGLKLEV
ncbi:Siroheme decarboxylase NirG subunit [Gammaproteobacteria bacterium]